MEMRLYFASGQMIDPQSFCNLKLAIARVMHASGASGLIAELYGDDDDDEAIVNQVDRWCPMIFFFVDFMIVCL